MSDIGVIACETLYADIAAIRPDARVRFVPQEFHEFPTGVPQPDAIAERVQTQVDALDGPDRERIVVVYARSGGGLAGVRTTHAPLVVSQAMDCVSLFTRGVEPETRGEPRAEGTYYLTRGWIDCGVDSFKLYHAYSGTAAALLDGFERVRDARRVTWNDGERYRRAVDRGRSMAPGSVGRFFHEIVGHFDRVALVDTGLLAPFDHEYAESFRGFVEGLRAEHGDGGSVQLSVIDGERSHLEALLSDAPLAAGRAERYPAGTPVE